MASTVEQALSNQNQVIRKLSEQVVAMRAQHVLMVQQMNSAAMRPRTITEEIDAISGRRIEYVLNDEQEFTAAQVGQRGQALTMTVSQDGPFIMTHYPMLLWRPSAPSNTPNLGFWRPVSTFPLPDQVVDTDIIDLMYEMVDGGNNRNFQSGPRGPILSRPDNMVPLPVPTMFSPNSTIQVIPTFNAITFNSSPAATEGILHVDLIGYRIVNL